MQWGFSSDELSMVPAPTETLYHIGKRCVRTRKASFNIVIGSFAEFAALDKAAGKGHSVELMDGVLTVTLKGKKTLIFKVRPREEPEMVYEGRGTELVQVGALGNDLEFIEAARPVKRSKGALYVPPPEAEDEEKEVKAEEEDLEEGEVLPSFVPEKKKQKKMVDPPEIVRQRRAMVVQLLGKGPLLFHELMEKGDGGVRVCFLFWFLVFDFLFFVV
jgi:hypothetical protein